MGKSIEIAIPQRSKDFNVEQKTSGVQGAVDPLNKAIHVDKHLGSANKVDLNHDQIRRCLESISKQMNLEIPENKKPVLEKSRFLQRGEMESH